MFKSNCGAPQCNVCRSVTVRSGESYKCLNCGNSMAAPAEPKAAPSADKPPRHVAADGMPHEVWICGTRFNIHLDNSLGPTWGWHGYVNPAKCLIVLNAKCAPEYLREVLHHEIVHAIDRLTNDSSIVQILRRPPDDKEMRMSEQEVLIFSRAHFTTYTDPRNAVVLKWMFG